MKVTILLPAYNAALYLRDSLDSIMRQAFKDFDVLLIDDGSMDDTSKIAIEYSNIDRRIKYYKNEKNIGLIKTLNKGLSLAKGEYIVRMDADDIMFDDRLYKQVKYMDSNPECFVCGGQMEYIGGLTGMAPILPQKYEDLLYLSLINCPLYHPTTIIRNSAIKQFGLKYNDSYKHAEDYKFWSDIIFSHPNSIANIKDVVLFYRISNNQITAKYSDEQDLISKIVRRENVQHVLVPYGIKLPEVVNCEIIEKVSSLIRKEHIDAAEILTLVLCMLYMSMENSYVRIKHFILSNDYSLFVKNSSRIKLGLSVLLSGIFSNRGKRFVI
ncbi:LPS biosynthesis related glycosyltransferase [Parabacteroides distasonis]|jgi:glycosyltransferase family 2|uniref:Glycosyltransferase family 2 n=1 Tax=Parabacteroides distasonis (strain ATCC 8503 / DSM 20701 / CIP 104284 / JCM 5825 / NCTC 11152) TaxID=435591 RepID=A6LBV5_PARD8|nr:glycosyltransferase family 2 protein [Parabacteroides distasonis]ABR43169.1 glycosyltransferase family 2 [Parabacteroides distasonis ATCC 8503]PNL10028.1 glycosyltransferase family 2 protein [Parabacteroides distasonis]QRO16643.1 glycosyltransferase family 2 protein [Parabacteroides distasonis]UEB12643.1 glycosyltransferase [Parabacteroides distasonis]SUV27110.1 LPS biosynthesis related glycosyltransferase [Parabacteroides distasonis]